MLNPVGMLAQDVWVERFESYCARLGISRFMLGYLAVNDGRFMARLRAGRVTMRVVNRVIEFTERYPDAGFDGGAIIRQRRWRSTPVPRNALGAPPLQVVDPSGRIWPTAAAAARAHDLSYSQVYHAALKGRDGWRLAGKTRRPRVRKGVPT